MKRTMLVVLLAAISLFAMVGTAHALPSQMGTVTVNASINKMVVLTITGGTVNFGAMDPGVSASDTVNINVRSNASYKVSRVLDSNCATMVVTVPSNTGFDGNTPYPKAPYAGGQSFTEEYDITIPWTTTPGDYTGYVVYTVTAS